MTTIGILGIDIAKNTFQLHGADISGKAVHKKALGSPRVGCPRGQSASLHYCDGGMRWGQLLGTSVPRQWPYGKANWRSVRKTVRENQ